MKTLIINSNKDGYTVWDVSTGFPIILMDAPYERLKADPEYAIEFIDTLYNEAAKGYEENKRLQVENEEYKTALMKIAHGDTWTAHPHDIAAWALGLKEGEKPHE